MRILHAQFVVTAVFVLAACRLHPAEEPPLRVFAAASLTDVMEALADSFETGDDTRPPVILNLAGSSLLARQIEQGAPADLFISAHPDWTDHLLALHKIEPPDTLPVSNRLVLLRRRQAANGGRIAVADPEHVPGGMYARDALACAGRWNAISDRLVPTLDVRAALAAVQEGAADAAIVYASDALFAPELTVSHVVSESCQPSVRYTTGIVGGGLRKQRAAEFLDFIKAAERGTIWRRFGFSFENGG